MWVLWLIIGFQFYLTYNVWFYVNSCGREKIEQIGLCRSAYSGTIFLQAKQRPTAGTDMLPSRQFDADVTLVRNTFDISDDYIFHIEKFCGAHRTAFFFLIHALQK